MAMIAPRLSSPPTVDPTASVRTTLNASRPNLGDEQEPFDLARGRVGAGARRVRARANREIARAAERRDFLVTNAAGVERRPNLALLPRAAR